MFQAAGIDMSCLSIVGRGVQPEEQVSFYTSGDRMKFWEGSAIGGEDLGDTEV